MKLLEVFWVRFARVSVARLRFVNYHGTPIGLCRLAVAQEGSIGGAQNTQRLVEVWMASVLAEQCAASQRSFTPSRKKLLLQEYFLLQPL